MPLHIIVDSTANVPQSLLAANDNLHVVPLSIRLGAQQWLEGTLSTEQLYELVAAGHIIPQTSQPAPGQFLRVMVPLVEAGHQVIIITLSGGLSGTWQSAKAAVDMVSSPDSYVIDSGTTAAGMVRMAEAALTAAAQGDKLIEIACKLEKMAKDTRTLFVPATLEYLHKGGRIGPAAALIGGILQIRPVLYLVDGKVAILDKVRTQQKAVARMVDELQKCREPAYVEVVHIEAAAEAAKLRQAIQQLYPGVQVAISTGGAVLGCHLGPGLLGVVFQVPSVKGEG